MSPAGDGTFHRLSWRRYYRSTKRWRDIALHDTGLIHFIVDPGAGNAKKWWTLSRWIFPRTHRISVARHPESLRFEVRDSAGVVWILEGTPQTQTRTSFEVKSIGGAPQRAGGLERNDAGILGVALGELYPILLEHNVHSYSPYAKYRARAYLNKKSVVRDQQGRACALSNRDLFLQTTDPTRPDSKLPFSTDPKWAQFLSRRCPQLDIEAIAHAQPPRPVPARRFSK